MGYKKVISALAAAAMIINFLYVSVYSSDVSIQSKNDWGVWSCGTNVTIDEKEYIDKTSLKMETTNDNPYANAIRRIYVEPDTDYYFEFYVCKTENLNVAGAAFMISPGDDYAWDYDKRLITLKFTKNHSSEDDFVKYTCSVNSGSNTYLGLRFFTTQSVNTSIWINGFGMCAYAKEKFINSGFENGLKNWYANSETALSVESDEVYSGTRAAAVNGNVRLYQYIKVEQNKDYEFSVYAKVNDKGGGAGIQVYTGGDTQWLNENRLGLKLFENTDDYRQYSLKFNSGDNTMLKITVTAWSADLKIDDIKLEYKNIPNGDFEDNSLDSYAVKNSSVHTITDSEVHNGSYALKVNKDRTEKPTVFGSSVTERCAGQYVFSVYAKSSGSAEMTLSAGDKDNKVSQTCMLTNKWEEYFVKCELALDGALYYEISAGTDEMMFYIDDMSICEYKQKNLFVAENGDDKNSGTCDYPLATLEGARRMLQTEQGTQFTVESQIVFDEGTYRFDKSVIFNRGNSGSKAAPVTIRNNDGKNVVFKGSKILDLSVMDEVTDAEALKRIPADMRSKIKCIDLLNNGIDHIRPIKYKLAGHQISPDKSVAYNQLVYEPDIEVQGEDAMLYLNNTEQQVAQWPNGHANYSYYSVVDPGGRWQDGRGGILVVDDENKEVNWQQAKDAYVAGNFCYNYIFERIPIESVDEEGNITLAHASSYTLDTTHTARHFKVFNLLEEIDIPGEFYIDKDNLKLYLYPPEDIENSVPELAVLRDDMIILDGADYINITGINFAQTCGNAILGKNTADYITVDNCNFKDIGVSAVYMIATGTSPINVSQEYRWADGNTAGNFWTVKNCIFFNTGDTALVMTGGSITDMKEGGPVIKNNYCNNCASKNKYMRGFVSLAGDGYSIIENNVAHNSPQGGVLFRSTNAQIQYNEFGNDVRESTDAGSVYTGRNSSCRGNVIAYNIMYGSDPKHPDLMAMIHNRSIYWDDAIAGQTAHHNFIFGSNDKAISSNGMSNKIYSNIIADSTNGIAVSTAWDSKDNGNFTLEKNTSLIDDNSEAGAAILEAFPEIYEEYKHGSETWFQDVYKNLAVNSTFNNITDVVKQRGKVENNILHDGYEIFVAPEKKDYRVKSEYAELFDGMNILTEDNFDIDSVGLQFNEKLSRSELLNSEFGAVYPQDNEEYVECGDLELQWKEAFGADRYRVILASDNEFTKVIADDYTWYPFYKVSGSLLSENTQYYWKIYAINDTRQLANVWEADKTYTFKTTPFLTDIDFDIVNSDGKEIITLSDVLEDGIVIAEMNITSSANQISEAVGVVYVLDTNNRLCAAVISNGNADNLPFADGSVTLDVSDLKKNQKEFYVKAVIWDNNMRPISLAKQLKVTGGF